MMRTENGDIVSSHPSPPFHSYSVFIVRMNTLTCRCSASSKLLSPNLFYHEKCAPHMKNICLSKMSLRSKKDGHLVDIISAST